jgi:hypothetical protein
MSVVSSCKNQADRSNGFSVRGNIIHSFSQKTPFFLNSIKKGNDA